MIAITGANGQLGRLVVDALLEKVPAAELVATVRSLEKGADLAARGVQVRVADYNRPETLEAAFEGVEKLLLISSSEVGGRAAQHKAVIDVASRAGVKLVAYTSLLHGDASSLVLADEHIQTEAYLKASGLPHVLLRNGWYAENYTGDLATARQHRAILGSAGEGRLSWASRADYADAAAAVLTSEVDQSGRVYELAGDQAYTLAEVAAEVARQTGEPIVYKDLPEAAFEQVLVGAGVPEGFAHVLADSSTGIARGALLHEGRQISALTGRPTETLEQSVARALRVVVHA